MSGALAVGDRAWVIFHEAATSAARSILRRDGLVVVGAALVNIETVAGEDAYGVRVVRGCGVAEETVHVVPRGLLFAVNDHEESASFGVEVRRLWGALPASLRGAVSP